MRSQNAGNAISETQNLKIFGGGIPPDPPRLLMPTALDRYYKGRRQLVGELNWTLAPPEIS